MVSFEEFKKLDLRLARVVAVEKHPDADKLYLGKIDVGDSEKQVVAGIREHYSPEELVGKKVVVINNLEPATIRGQESNGMILAAGDGNAIAVLTSDKDVDAGTRIT